MARKKPIKEKIDQSEIHNRGIKFQTMIMAGCILFALGFVSGVAFTAYKTSSKALVAANQKQGEDMDRMILALEEEVKTNPKNSAAWIQLGNVYFDLNQYEKAIKAYDKSVAIDPFNANVLTDLGVMYRRNGQPEKAIESFNQALKVDPRHEISRFNKGIVLLNDLKDQKGAIEAWEDLLKLNPMAQAPNGQSVKDLIRFYKNNPKK